MAKKIVTSIREKQGKCYTQDRFEQMAVAHITCNWSSIDKLNESLEFNLKKVEHCSNCIRGVRTGCRTELKITPEIRSVYTKVLKGLQSGIRTPISVHDELQDLLEKGNQEAGNILANKFYDEYGFPKPWFKKWLVRAGRWANY